MPERKFTRIDIPGWGYAVVDKTLLRKKKSKTHTKVKLLTASRETAVKWVHSAETYEFGTSECMQKRLGGINASDANTIVTKNKSLRGKNPYMSMAALMRKKMKIDKRVDNIYTRHGIRYEQEALDSCAKILGIEYSETVGHVRGHGQEIGKIVRGCVTIAEVPEYLGATPDALTTDARLVECKCPSYDFEGGEEIMDRYYPQLQMQMACCNLTECVFVRYRPFSYGTTGVIDIARVDFDPEWWKGALEEFKLFYNSMNILRAMSKPDIWATIKGDRFRGPGAKRLWMEGRSIRREVADEGDPPLRKKRKKKQDDTSTIALI